ncbi:amidase [Leucobacter sp. CSA2]|uniref:Amidase n=1 Tax=Leucobacter edaphi TaxID=2796472 RepID=A0A934QDK3_9MICO|nr:amidase family protein [Leucobacter edaphi]MBK0422248.1 amidase [Leucobacter edaphi]
MSETSDQELVRRPALEQLELLARGELSAVELLAETRRAIEIRNPVLNAVVTTDFGAAEAAAAASDRRRAAELPVRPLEGLPVAVKDLEDTARLRTTYGSRRFADHVPVRDSLVVERMRAAGAIIIGKTNTPEFGTGSHTYNGVFGTTVNPYDPARSAGGSSGGAAAALAAGFTSVADGSDMGGSLRNPAAFCNVVGLRPTAGRVPNWPGSDSWDTLATNGPMARTVADTALLLSVLSGADGRSPIAIAGSLPASIPVVESAPLLIGWSRTLGGLEIEAEISSVLERDGRPTLAGLGHRVIDVEPDFTGADRAFRVLRGLNYADGFGEMLAEHRELLGPELVQNTEFGLGLSLDDFHAARRARQRVHERFVELFARIDVLAAPVTMALPFLADEIWPKEVGGVAQHDYLDWMRASWRISLTGYPALSIPCGFSEEGLPVGLQLVGRPGSEAQLLALARQFERERPVWQTGPPWTEKTYEGTERV